MHKIKVFAKIKEIKKAWLEILKKILYTVREELNKSVKGVEELITKYIWLNSIRAGNLDKEKSEIEKNVINELRFLCNSNELDFLALEEYVKNAKNATNDSFIKYIIKLVNIFENIKKESGNNIKNVLDF